MVTLRLVASTMARKIPRCSASSPHPQRKNTAPMNPANGVATATKLMSFTETGIGANAADGGADRSSFKQVGIALLQQACLHYRQCVHESMRARGSGGSVFCRIPLFS